MRHEAVASGVERRDVCAPASPCAQIDVLARAAMVASEAVSCPVVARFRKWAERQPASTAGSFAGRTLSYGELDALSDRLAQRLAEEGVGPSVVVAVCVEPGLEILVALLGIFKAGGVYLPLDPTHPPALVAAMRDEAKPLCALTTRSTGPLLESVPQLLLDDEQAVWRRAEARVLNVFCTPEAALSASAYLLYTSGTTGAPKAARASHANLAHYLGVACASYGFDRHDVFCSLARYTFSISLFELLVPLSCGAAVRLDGRLALRDFGRLAELLAQVTVVHAGPSLLAAFFQHLRTASSPVSFPNVRHASSGGDMVGPHIMEQLKRTFDGAEIYVIYGCTEISCMGTSYRVERGRSEQRALVGAPFAGMRCELLDEQGRAVAPGEVGEVAFSGPGVVDGYLARPELDAQRFVRRAEQTYYLTGDLGRIVSGGQLELLGRRDHQVKVRGMRVELSGIEQTLLRLQLAVQCAVVAKPHEDDTQLVAYVVGPRQAPRALRAALARSLPDYMVPQHIVALEELPLTANGKVDRGALARRAWEGAAALTPSQVPRGALEQSIAAVFAEGLRVPPSTIPRDVDFFDLGGHSLLAVTVRTALEQTLGRPLSPGILFECGTVRGLACHARGERAVEQRPVPLNQTGAARKLFMVAGVHVYRELARRLAHSFEVFGVYTGCELTLLGENDDALDIPTLARAYIALIRKEQPHGPYYLGGTSFGGIVVYEVAQQLRRAGEQVAFLGMIDAILPEHTLASWLRRATRLAHLPPRELLRLVYDRMRVKLLRARDRRRATEFARYADDERFALIEIVRADAQAKSAIRYMRQIRRWHAPLTLVIAGARLRDNPHKARDCGWSRWVDRLDAHVIDADHLAVLEEPKVEELAAVFARAAETDTCGTNVPLVALEACASAEALEAQ